MLRSWGLLGKESMPTRRSRLVLVRKVSGLVNFVNGENAYIRDAPAYFSQRKGAADTTRYQMTFWLVVLSLFRA